MRVTTEPRLTSAEIGMMWNMYMNDSVGRCILRYFLETSESDAVKALLNDALGLANRQVEFITTLFHKEGIAVPQGFGDSDVHLSSPKLFSDQFMIRYLKNVSRQAMAAYSVSNGVAQRQDITAFFTEALLETTELFNRITSYMLETGTIVRFPIIEYPKQVIFGHDESYLSSGWFEKPRTLNVNEITHIALNLQVNQMIQHLLTGFSQTAQTKEIKQFFARGKQIAFKHVQLFEGFLREEEIQVPGYSDSEVTTSTIAPFSEKLMLSVIMSVVLLGITNYGGSLATAQRRDIGTAYLRLIAEVAQYGEDGAEIGLRNGWLELPPQAPDRSALVK
ncbi:DUF3231 family protein [Paenibacillus turpanensis]|uniref:DUF3231 family protein n=1 Tax=Paenibacillus turpanensis TaxID=2689078 RepID=UPI0014073E9F|nr:DUF3231 family protein [Paenibacillus turpanensis]